MSSAISLGPSGAAAAGGFQLPAGGDINIKNLLGRVVRVVPRGAIRMLGMPRPMMYGQVPLKAGNLS